MLPRANRWATTASLVALVAIVALAAYRQAGAGDGSGPGRTETRGELRSEMLASPDALPPEAPPALDPSGPSAVASGPSAVASGAPVLRFVYFVEADEEYDPESLGLISQQSLALQHFWYDQFGGTFVAARDVTVIYGDHPASWYDTTPVGDDPRWYRLTNIRDEVRVKLGIDPEDPSARFVVYPNARIDGRVGANRYAGAVMDGDDIACISGSVDTTPYSADYPANCLATVAHELGHVFGLTHAGPDDDCMQFGFYQYVNQVSLCQFSAENRSLVINDPANAGWLGAKPGDQG